MRARDDIPQKEIARHMVAYAHDDPEYARSVFAGKTQSGRTLVHEAALDPEDMTRVLDYERATHLVREAKAWAVSLCYCRHVMEHEGKSVREAEGGVHHAELRGRVRRPPRPRKEDLPGGGARHLRADARGRAGAHRRQRPEAPGVRLPLLRLLLRHALRHQPVQDVRRGRDLLLRGGVRSGEVQRLRAVREAVPRVGHPDRGGGERGRRRPCPPRCAWGAGSASRPATAGRSSCPRGRSGWWFRRRRGIGGW